MAKEEGSEYERVALSLNLRLRLKRKGGEGGLVGGRRARGGLLFSYTI